MKRMSTGMIRLLGIAALASAAAVGMAAAQPYGAAARGQPSATLYELPNFQGRQTVISGHAENLSRSFNDQARSARFQGRWRVCEDSDYRGRCVDMQGDVADLNAMGFAERITSLQSYADVAEEDDRDDRDSRYDRDDRDTPRYGGGPGGGSGGERDRRGTDGARNVFFPYPSYRGADVPAGAGSADRFCRSNGLSGASYFDTDYQTQRTVDDRNRFAPSGGVLRDVLCRR